MQGFCFLFFFSLVFLLNCDLQDHFMLLVELWVTQHEVAPWQVSQRLLQITQAQKQNNSYCNIIIKKRKKIYILGIPHFYYLRIPWLEIF